MNILNVTAANLADTLTGINALVAAADDIGLGILNRRIMTLITNIDGTTPTDEEAQREEKWLIGCTDTLANLAAGVTNPYFGKNFVTSLPACELTGHLPSHSDFADLSETDTAAFVAAFEAFARSPSGGTVAVTYIKHVGRNN
jgi:hypothetical protein